MNNDITMLILSCEKFSDLWDAHVSLLEKNWPDRNMDTYIITDHSTVKNYKNIKIIVGEDLEWSDRLAFALKNVKTKYVFITLDDYFLIKKVNDSSINNLVSMMNQEELDYVRLFPNPKKATEESFKEYSGIYKINTKINYSVNLYAGIWSKEFIEYTIKDSKNAWQFEASLYKRALEYKANCVVSSNKEFEILDVVRKGKLLHKSAAYFKRHPEIYTGTRPVNSRSYEIKLWIQTVASRYFPNTVKKTTKSLMRALGMHFFSDELE